MGSESVHRMTFFTFFTSQSSRVLPSTRVIHCAGRASRINCQLRRAQRPVKLTSSLISLPASYRALVHSSD